VQQPIGDLQSRLADEFPGSPLQARSTPGGIVLTGEVESADAAHHAEAVAKLFIGPQQSVVNQLRVASSTQVHLRVRVAEVSRETLKELGINLQTFFNVGAARFGMFTGRDFLNDQGQLLQTVTGASGLLGGYHTGRVDVNALIDALARDNVISMLAEPSLTAVSGETASFLAGGEFPVPVATGDANNDRIYVEFKRFGVSLDFTPTVLSAGRISLKVRPEVSELSDQGAVITRGISIPALSVRRAETTVELASGQSFAIAGLFRDDTRTAADRVPALGEIPVLGSLFRSSNFKRNESELVILVTPYVVHPVSGAGLGTPADRFLPASDLERIFLGRLNRTAEAGATAPGIGPGGLRLHGDAGFTLD
jgi:pilus assembly protein CpaC